jgi:signal transduction histidine kinase
MTKKTGTRIVDARIKSEVRFPQPGIYLTELELLYLVSQASVEILSIETLSKRIVAALENLLNWNSSIWILEDQIPVLLANWSVGLTGDKIKNESIHVDIPFQSLEEGIVGWVCTNGQSLRYGDIKKQPEYGFTDQGINSVLCVPLKIGGKILGCINVVSEHLQAFKEQDERLLATLANQFAVAIENVHLFEETRRRAIRQAALNAIITVSARAEVDPAEILNSTLEQTLKALSLDMGAIWLSWSIQGVQRMVSKNIPQEINSATLNAALAFGTSMAKTLAVDDWHNRRNRFSEQFILSGISSTIVVPLVSNDKRIGGLAIASRESRHWTAEEIALVDAIGREVGSAAERARLFEQTSARLNELEAVNKVSKNLRKAQSLQEMLPQLMDETLKILGVEAGSIWLFNSERGKLCQMIGRGWCRDIIGLEFEAGESLLGTIFSIGDIYFSHDVALDPMASPEMQELIPKGWNALCIPIHSEQEPIGVFVISTPLPHEFTTENASLLVTLTDIAGNAIHRTRLTEQMMHHAAELELRVTERTTELQSALQKAQAADRLKSEFIANVNHELRTPLTNLVLYYQMLRSQPSVKTADRLDVIGRELQRLRGLIEQLLNLSRFDLGQVSLRPEKSNLNTLIQTLVNDRRSLAEEHQLTLVLDLLIDLPSIWIDESMMVQAISNLLTNAMSYTPHGGKIIITTMTKLRDENIWVGYRIQDTGPGIDSEDLPHLFERFYRGKAGHHSGASGTGLGLAIVKQVIEQHHGKIDVQNSADGHGAVFSVWLPVKKQQETI